MLEELLSEALELLLSGGLDDEEELSGGGELPDEDSGGRELLDDESGGGSPEEELDDELDELLDKPDDELENESDELLDDDDMDIRSEPVARTSLREPKGK